MKGIGRAFLLAFDWPSDEITRFNPLSPVPLFRPQWLEDCRGNRHFLWVRVNVKVSQRLKGLRVPHLSYEDLATKTGINEQGFFLGIGKVLDAY